MFRCPFENLGKMFSKGLAVNAITWARIPRSVLGENNEEESDDVLVVLQSPKTYQKLSKGKGNF